jgi:hypothetical protein
MVGYRNVSVFDWVAALHRWSLPGITIIDTSLHPWALEDDYSTSYSGGHSGSGSITWHRSLTIAMEFALQLATKNFTFSLPYWNWTSSYIGDQEETLKWFGGDGDSLSRINDGQYCRSRSPVHSTVQHCNCYMNRGPFANWPLVGDWGVALNDTIMRAFGCQTLWGPSIPEQEVESFVVTVPYYDDWATTVEVTAIAAQATAEADAVAAGAAIIAKDELEAELELQMINLIYSQQDEAKAEHQSEILEETVEDEDYGIYDPGLTTTPTAPSSVASAAPTPPSSSASSSTTTTYIKKLRSKTHQTREQHIESLMIYIEELKIKRDHLYNIAARAVKRAIRSKRLALLRSGQSDIRLSATEDDYGWGALLNKQSGTKSGITKKQQHAHRVNLKTPAKDFTNEMYQDEVTHASTFHDILGGGYPGNYASWPSAEKPTELHERIHRWVGGTILGEHPGSDPLFWLLHGYADLILERWLRNAIAAGTFGVDNSWGTDDEALSHGRDECQAPFFPLVRHIDVWTNSKALGFNYDYFDNIPTGTLEFFTENQMPIKTNITDTYSLSNETIPTTEVFFAPSSCDGNSTCCPYSYGMECGGSTRGTCVNVSTEACDITTNPSNLWYGPLYLSSSLNVPSLM